MKIIKLIFIFCFLTTTVFASNEQIVGKWHYYKKIYQGVEMPEGPEATLQLFFEFYADGTDRLYWYHTNENDWCERQGRYSIADNTIIDKVTWVNPKNSMACSQDPDMQLDHISMTEFHFESDELYIHFFINEDILLYVWKRVTE